MDRPTMMVLLLGAVLFFLWRSRELRIFQVFVAALMGFFLAGSGLADTISDWNDAVIGWVSTWRL